MPPKVRAASATPAPRRRLLTSRIDLSATATALLKDAESSFEDGSPGNASLATSVPSGRANQSVPRPGMRSAQSQHRILNDSVESLASSATLRPTSAGRQRLHHKPTAAQPNAAPRTVSPAIVPSPASAEAVHGRVERLSRLHRNWPGWGSHGSPCEDDVSDREGVDLADDDQAGAESRSSSASHRPRKTAAQRTSRREHLHALAREVTAEGTAVWSIVSEIGEALREANVKPQRQHPSPSSGSAASTTQQMQAASARAAATATAALESLTTLFDVD